MTAGSGVRQSGAAIEAFARTAGVEIDRDLFQCLAGLSQPQRVSVLLVHAYRWTYQEVADVLDITVAAVTNHVHRGLARLRTELQEQP